MTRSARRRIFYALLALFLVAGTGVVLYAEGWRIDFATWRVAKVGGIFIHSFPDYASITVDGEPVQNQSGFLTGGTLVSNLLPRQHSVTLTASGYEDWHENARVLPSLVVQFKYAVLVPKAPTSASSTATANAAPTPSPINPFNANQEIIPGKNRIFVFDIAQATTTLAIKTLGMNLAAAWITPNMITALQDDGSLYLYDTNTNLLRKLASDVKTFAAADDGSAVAALEHGSLEIFSLIGDNNYYRFNIPDVGSATRLIWYRDRTHLFVVYPDHASFLDLMDADLANFLTVANGTNPQYDPKTNSFFIMNTAGKLLRYAFPG